MLDSFTTSQLGWIAAAIFMVSFVTVTVFAMLAVNTRNDEQLDLEGAWRDVAAGIYNDHLGHDLYMSWNHQDTYNLRCAACAEQLLMSWPRLV